MLLRVAAAVAAALQAAAEKSAAETSAEIRKCYANFGFEPVAVVVVFVVVVRRGW